MIWPFKRDRLERDAALLVGAANTLSIGMFVKAVDEFPFIPRDDEHAKARIDLRRYLQPVTKLIPSSLKLCQGGCHLPVNSSALIRWQMLREDRASFQKVLRRRQRIIKQQREDQVRQLLEASG